MLRSPSVGSIGVARSLGEGMREATGIRPIEILLVEDDEADARLAGDVLMEAKVCNNVSWVRDGLDALRFLRREEEYASSPEPDLILLDLSLVTPDAPDVLAEVEKDGSLRRIPVVILRSPCAEEDVARSYDVSAKYHITKPIDLDQFSKVVRGIEGFWFSIVRLPTTEGHTNAEAVAESAH